MRALAITLLTTLCSACAAHRVQVEPVQVEPIHVTVDVNLNADDAPATANKTATADE